MPVGKRTAMDLLKLFILLKIEFSNSRLKHIDYWASHTELYTLNE